MSQVDDDIRFLNSKDSVMETTLRTLQDRLRRANFEHNSNPKYRQYATGSDYYTKITNKQDEMMRVSYYLVNFLVSCPRLLPPGDSNAVEPLPDYDDQEKKSNDMATKKWNYTSDNYTLHDLQDLPITQESEFDANLVMFHSFIAFIKPVTYFINKHEMVPPIKKESRDQNATRVLMNLAQLLLFARSVTEKDEKDILFVIYALFFRFPHFFTIEDDNLEPQAGDSDVDMTIDPIRSFFELYPEESCNLLIILIAYDDHHDIEIEKFKEQVQVFTSSPAAQSGEFAEALKVHEQMIENSFKESKTTAECCEKLKTIVSFEAMKGSILSVAKSLTTKVLKQTNNFATWDLHTSFFNINYPRKVRDLKQNHEDDISNLTTEIKKEINEAELERHIKLETDMNALKQQCSLLNDENETMRLEMEVLKADNARLRQDVISLSDASAGKGALPNFEYSDFEKMYPELLKDIKVKTFRMAAKKSFARIENLENELASLRHTIESAENNGSGATGTAASYHYDNGTTTREPDNIEEPEYYEQSLTSYDPHNGNNYYGRSVIPPQRQAGYYNNDRSYRTHPTDRMPPANRPYSGASRY
ncbi:hypothetical protein BON22_5447 [Cyberlindnera fabianii]|uniref:Uncharacterized protein n=1 Tax=Cyberlindnera fabianii TaxID=36022 RepID=A0A1V2KYF3_CYBFA|nr:hypothetical protein BON22_5447 [Cyberlindnera fabianii]